MEKYEKPWFSVIEIAVEDIMVVSGGSKPPATEEDDDNETEFDPR